MRRHIVNAFCTLLALAFLAVVLSTATARADPYRYPIISKEDSRCLTALSTRSSLRAQILDCTTSDGQRFQFKTQQGSTSAVWDGFAQHNLQIIFSHSDKCLAVASGYTRPGTEVQQKACDGSTRQRWSLLPIDESYFEVMHVGSGLCLTQQPYPACTPGASLCFGDANYALLDYCRGTYDQQWAIAQLRYLEAVHSGKCLSIKGRSRIPDAGLVQNECVRDANQLWFRRPNRVDWGYSGPRTRWVSLRSGLCVDAYYRNTLVQYHCEELWDDEQLWKYGYTHRTNHPALNVEFIDGIYCMDVSGHSREDDVRVGRYRCHGGANQQWLAPYE